MRQLGRIRDYMTHNPVVIDVDTPTLEAFLLMSEYDLRHLPVEKNCKLVGVISERDILKVWSESRGAFPVVEAAMTPLPYVVDPNEKMETILPVMAENRLGCVVIKKSGEKVSGIFTTTDALRVLAEMFQTEKAE